MNYMALFQFLFAIILLVSPFQVGLGNDAPEGTPVAVRGVLDLGNWNLLTEAPIKLEGEWEFYWNQFVMPRDFTDELSPAITGYANVPGYWNFYSDSDREFPGSGFATYRLMIKNLAPRQTVAFDIKTINTSYTLFVNGKVVALCGTTGIDKSSSVPAQCPGMPTYYLDSSSAELVLHVSNFYHAKGGFWAEMSFGNFNAVSSMWTHRTALDLFLIGSILIIGLYHLGLFRLRTKDRSTLYFSICCLIIALRTSFHNATFFYVAFPDFDWQTYLRMDYATLYIPVITFLLFFSSLYPKEFSKPLSRLIFGCSVIYGLMTFVTDTSVFSGYLFLFQIVVVITCVYLLWAITLARLRKRTGTGVVLVGCIILIATVLNDILYAQTIISTVFISSIGLFAFIFSQSYVISKRFTSALDTAEVLSKTLEQKVSEQTAAIKDLLDNTGQGIFSFDKELNIQQYASRETQAIFGSVITGKHATELMFPENSPEIEGFIDVIFESGGKVKLVKDLLPAELEKNNRIFEISYRWIPSGNNTDGNIMIILDDVTIERKLENMLEKDKQRDLKILRVAVDRYGFLRFYDGIKSQLDLVKESLKSGSEGFTVDELSGMFHTIKGGTAAYGFQKTADIAHELETALNHVTTDHKTVVEPVTGEIEQYLDRIREALRDELEEVKDLIPEEFLQARKTSFYTISEDAIKKLETLVVQRINDDPDLQQAFLDVRKQPMRNVLKKIAADAEGIAQQQGKKIKVLYSGEQSEILHKPLEDFFSKIVHLIRNTVDHGIEKPLVRSQAGKPEDGLLEIAVSLENNCLKMSFADDGAGIDPVVIRQKALEKKLISQAEQEKLTDEEAIQLIYRSGFSTQKIVTGLSGRGVGLYALHDSIEKLGGSISLSSVVGKGTTFTISIPLDRG